MQAAHVLNVLLLLQGREGKIVQVYRKKWVIHIERITREKVNGAPLFETLEQRNVHILLFLMQLICAGHCKGLCTSACSENAHLSLCKAMSGNTWNPVMEWKAQHALCSGCNP